MQPKLRYIVCFFSAIVMGLTLMTPFQAIATTAGSVDIRVSDISDDAQEEGVIVTTAIDVLPLGEQLCGLRFQNIAIPPNSLIVRAYLQFTADTVSDIETYLTFYAEKTGHALAFDPAQNNNISNRVQTKASVTWDDIPAWGEVGETGVGQQTPDLKSIVQEVVNLAGWTEGNAMVFIVDGSGSRIAQAYQSGSEVAPFLHIDYVANAIEARVEQSSDDAEEWLVDNTMHINSPDLDMDGTKLVGVRFANVNIPKGALITSAYLEFAASNVHSENSTIRIYLQDQVNPITFSATDHDISSRAVKGLPIEWNPVPVWDSLYEKYRSPDLRQKIQEMIGDPGWAANHAMVFIIEATVSRRRAMTYDSSMDLLGTNDLAPLLHIEYATDLIPYISTDAAVLGGSATLGNSPAADSLTLSNSGNADLNYTISIDPVDTSWLSLSSASGTLTAGLSQTIDVIYDTSSLLEGIYEARITIEDPNALNSPVEIQVSVTIFPPPTISDCNIPVYVENVVSPAILVLLDVSGSMDTLMNVTPDQTNPQTPDLKDIVQEIVDRAGWQSGNAMVFIIEGSGRRVAKAFDNNSGSAPLLHVAYNDGTTDHELNIRVSASDDDAEETAAGSVSTRSSDLDLGENNQIIGLRFRNVTIPKLATVTITNAYIEFVADESDDVVTNQTIWGQDLDNPWGFSAWGWGMNYNNISNRTKTSASVAWNMTAADAWDAATLESRIEIGKSVISELVKDRSISWGFGTWTASSSGYDATNDYTKIHVGCKFNDAAQQTALQDAIAQVRSRRMTPFGPSIKAAEKYFTGLKTDESGDLFVNYDCQPKFMINMTDGIGNTGSTVEIVHNNTDALADADVSAVGIGFGLSYDEAEQLYELAAVANDRGDDSDTDQLYDMHPVEGGVVQPYFAFNKEELSNTLAEIADRVKGVIFHGSAPAPTTSSDLGDMVIVAKFDASRWIGDLVAVRKDANGLWLTPEWKASEQLPATRNIWTVDPNDGVTEIEVNTTVLDPMVLNCFDTQEKPIGDIINSTPVVVGYPPFFYPFDNYFDFAQNLQREAMIYIGANDGSLHAIDLDTGIESWAFVPIGMHEKLNKAVYDETYDRCATGYCHQYYIDGSAQVGDVYAKFNGVDKAWRTVLVVGEREGGETYFALDVTSGKGFDDWSDPTEFLWEFTDSELGQTWGNPSISRVAEKSPSTDTTWGVFFGSGYVSDPAEQANKEAYVYGIQAHDASDLWMDSQGYTINRIKMSAEDLWVANVTNYPQADSSKHFTIGEIAQGQSSGAEATVIKVEWTSADEAVITFQDVSGNFIDNEQIKGKGLSTHQADLVGNLQAASLPNDALAAPLLVNREDFYISDRIYVGNLYGNMYRVTDIGKHMTPQVSEFFSFNAADPNQDHPIRAKADYAYSQIDGEVWIYFGTGRYEIQADKEDNTQQYFFGLKDDAQLQEYTLDSINVELEARFATTQINGNDVTVRYVQGSNGGAESWKMKLYEGSFPNGPTAAGSERVLSQPLVVAGIVFFTTFIPDEDVCAGTGESWLIAVDYNTGQGATTPVFDINSDGSFDASDKVLVNGEYVVPIGIKVGRGRGSHPVLHKNTMFVTITGDGSDDGDGGGGEEFFADDVNIPGKKIRIETWRQAH